MSRGRSISASVALVASLLVIVATSGCESITETGFSEYEPELVVLSLFEPDSAWTAHVHHTVGVEQGAARDTLAVTDAQVVILAEGRIVAKLGHIGNGVYRDVKNSPAAGQDYTIRVSSPGFPTATATASIPETGPAPSLFIDNVSGSLSETEELIRVEFDDLADSRDYYLLRLYADRGADVLRRVEIDSDDPILRDGFVVNVFGADDNLSDPVFSDDAFNGRSMNADLRVAPDPVNRYVAEVLRVSESYYRYLRSLQGISEIHGNPFAETAQPYTNVDAGRGIFGGFQRRRAELIVGGITPEVIAGSYQARSLQFRTGDERRVVLIPGEAQFKLNLTDDGLVDGSILVEPGFDPADPERSIDARLQGTFHYDGRFVSFDLDSETFLEDVRWTFEYLHPCGRLSAMQSDSHYFAVLLRECPQDM